MASTLHLGEGIRDNFVRVFCLIGLTFVCYFLYLDWKYKYYLEDYRKAQKQEEQTVNAKTTETIRNLRVLAKALGKTILSAPEDYRKIQKTLAAGLSVSQNFDDTPTVHYISYYKLSDFKAMITPSTVVPLHYLPTAFKKPIKDLESLTIKDNEMVGTIPVLDQNKHLKGVLEIKVPYVDIHKFVGVDKLKTLEFPQMYDIRGKQLIQDEPLDFTFKNPLSYSEYMTSYASQFWTLVYAVLIGSILLFLSGILVKKRLSLAFGSQIGQLSKELESLNTHRSSLQVYNTFQGHIIQRFKELTGVIHKTMAHVEPSYGASSLENRILISETEKLAQALSSGLCPNLQRESLFLGDLLDQIKLQFADQIQKLNIKWYVTCPEDLTVVGDPLFIKMVLLNVIGTPLYSTPKNGAVSISVTKENGFVHIEVRDNRYSLTNTGKQYLKIPFEFFVETQKLRQICIKNRIGYEFFEIKGEFMTKVSFPLEPDQIHKGNVIPLPR